MVRKSKWLEGVDADDPVSDAARQALEQRLELVWHYLTRASDRRPESEDIHQLRVTVRRASAVLEAYADVVPSKRAAWFEKKLRQTRKAANDARDFDVLCARLEARTADEHEHGWRALLKCIRRLRDKAQKPIERIAEQLRKKDFVQRIEQVVDRTAWRHDTEPEPTFAEAAQHRLERLAEPFFSAGRGELRDIEALHQFRICGKRLRYAIEIFAALSPELRGDIYPEIEQLQERLGEINDHASAVNRYRGWAAEWNEPALAEPLETLVIEEKTALEIARRSFHTWWTDERSGDLERRFLAAIHHDVAEQVA